eukprot:CAMPEP_0172489528 /NCGR_PEP_ID=MMETSP1066-20121228/19589_1 /TAXON_ID=671091 /ORGANISM="Coscinodiscus wailesii, Strain CCMP2513" /LENGTH=107 /DNA_ID=CAMNT_0013257463 /DNA_START=107 /DNA_END=430 /DNA_ORIENTATION=-
MKYIILLILASIIVTCTGTRKPSFVKNQSLNKGDDFVKAEESIFKSVEDAEKKFLDKVETIVHSEVDKLHKKNTAFVRGKDAIEMVAGSKDDIKECLDEMLCGDIDD